MKNKKGNSMLIIIIIILTAISASAITWLFATRSQLPVQNQINEARNSSPVVSPKMVVKSYTDYTLGIPAKYDLAKQYLIPEMQAQFSAPGFVPKSYGIQDVPNNVVVKDEKISGDKAIVEVVGQYLTTQKIWEFTLTKFNSEWRISSMIDLGLKNENTCVASGGKSGFVMHDGKCYAPGEIIPETDCKVSSIGGCERIE